MPSRFDSATLLDTAADLHERDRLDRFANHNRLQLTLRTRVLPIFGLSNIEEATIEQLRIIFDLLQTASMYSPVLDPDGVEPIQNPAFAE